MKMMSTFEHWAHRLFPKASFDDFIERLEKLGSKKAVQVNGTCVHVQNNRLAKIK